MLQKQMMIWAQNTHSKTADIFYLLHEGKKCTAVTIYIYICYYVVACNYLFPSNNMIMQFLFQKIIINIFSGISNTFILSCINTKEDNILSTLVTVQEGRTHRRNG